ARLGRLDAVAVVRPAVGVPAGAPAVPVAGPVELLGAALGDDLYLAAHGAPVLRLIGVRQDLELGDGVDVGARHVAAVVAGVDVRDAVDRDVVRVLPLAVDGEAVGRLRRAAAGALLKHAGNERGEREEGSSVVGDVAQRLALQRERPLTTRRLHLADAAGDADFLGDLADVERQHAGR